MKILKKVIYKYDEITPTSLEIKDMDVYLKEKEFTNDNVNFFYELGETDNFTVFMNMYGLYYDGNKTEGRIYQIETAIIHKKNKEMIYMGDNYNFVEIGHMSKFPIWSSAELESLKIERRELYTDEYYDLEFKDFVEHEDLVKMNKSYFG